MIVARIDRDYLFDADKRENNLLPNAVSRVGTNWTTGQFLEHLVIPTEEKIRFRCKDDDGQVYYGGWLINDDECIVQYTVLRFTEHDAGCTTIEVKIDDRWKQEIG